MTDTEWLERHGYILSDEGAKTLAAAILEQACKDYLHHKWIAEFGDRSRSASSVGELILIKKFFRGGICEMIADYNPERLLKDLDDRYESNPRVIAKRALRGGK